MKHVFVEHELKKDLWLSKKDLFNQFFGAFYDFIKTHSGEKALQENAIHSKEEFLAFASDWNSGGRDSCYGLGFGFSSFFLEESMKGSLATQSENYFVGYCLKNHQFEDFLNFLVSFFAYWRNDEGCTCFNPYNYCDNFFVSSWASLVDTAKLFYFSSETVYWWQSFRVKYVLDHIPGVMLEEFKEEEDLPKVKVAGYEFLGWFANPEDETPITSVTKGTTTVYGKLKRRDVYNYWEKEEKTIVKVYDDKNYHRVDPK
jgi:hypothetical protein